MSAGARCSDLRTPHRAPEPQPLRDEGVCEVSVRIEPEMGAQVVPDTADELVTDRGWRAQCDQVRAALHRTTLPVYGGSVDDELAAQRFGGAR